MHPFHWSGPDTVRLSKHDLFLVVIFWQQTTFSCLFIFRILIKVIKGAKFRNRYN